MATRQVPEIRSMNINEFVAEYSMPNCPDCGGHFRRTTESDEFGDWACMGARTGLTMATSRRW